MATTSGNTITLAATETHYTLTGSDEYNIYGNNLATLNEMATKAEKIIAAVPGATDTLTLRNDGVQYLQVTTLQQQLDPQKIATITQAMSKANITVDRKVLADIAVRTLHLPLPANLTGMLLLLACILLGVVKAQWFEAGARWLLAEMLLFFVPAVVAVVNYAQLLMVDGWRIFLVIGLSTTMVLGATAWVVDKVYRYEVSRMKHE